MIAVDVKASGDLKPPAFTPAPPQLEASFHSRSGVFRPRRIRGRAVPVGVRNRAQKAGLETACLRAKPRVVSEFHALLDPYLRLPQPQISCSGKRGDSYLRQRIGIARRYHRLGLTKHYARIRPIQIDLRSA